MSNNYWSNSYGTQQGQPPQNPPQYSNINWQSTGQPSNQLNAHPQSTAYPSANKSSNGQGWEGWDDSPSNGAHAAQENNWPPSPISMYPAGNQEVPPRNTVPLKTNQYSDYSVLNGQDITDDTLQRRVLGQFQESTESFGQPSAIGSHWTHENQETPNAMGQERNQVLEPADNSAFSLENRNVSSGAPFHRQVTGHGDGTNADQLWQNSVSTVWQIDNEETPSQVTKRDQYLEPAQLNGLSTEEENTPPPLGPRLVPGQFNEQENQWSNTQNQSWTLDNQENPPRCPPNRDPFSEPNESVGPQVEDESAPPPGLDRLVTGQLNEHEVSVPPAGLDRMIPGQLTEGESMRLVPGRFTQDEDDLPGRGLHRMVPGESSSPESQAAALPQPRVVTGVDRDSDGNNLSANMSQLILKVESRGSSPAIENENSSLPQPPSERSETIGSDNVDTPDLKTPLSQPKSERRIREDMEEEGRERDRDRDGDRDRSRDYYRDHRGWDRDDSERNRDRDRDGSPSDSGSTRYRDDRDNPSDRRYESRRNRDRDRDESPSGRSRYRADRDVKERDRDRDKDDWERERDWDRERRSYDTRRSEGRKMRRGYQEEEGDTDGYGSDSDVRDRDRDRIRDRGDRDRADRDRAYYSRRSDRDRDRPQDRDRGDDHKRYRERYRGDVDRDYHRERDRDRDRGADPRDGPDYDRGPRPKPGRRSDDYYDDDYYSDPRRSRPSSRSGSLHEYTRGYPEFGPEGRPADRHKNPYYSSHKKRKNAGDYYYNNKAQELYMYLMNARQNDPETYAAWYRKYYGQYAASQGGTFENYTEDRGSVHSGRSSANEDLHDRFNRHKSPEAPQRAQGFYSRSPARLGLERSSDYSSYSHHSGRTTTQPNSLLDETGSSVQRLTPFKFTTAHVRGCLTFRGQLIKVVPHYPMDGQPAIVEMHSIENVLAKDRKVMSLTDLPGPLVLGMTHKKTVMTYLREKIQVARNDNGLVDRQSEILLYELLILLLQQNGAIVGTDVAELLLKSKESYDGDVSSSTGPLSEQRSRSTPSPNTSVGRESRTSSSGALASAAPHNTSQSPHLSEAAVTNKFREYLLYGNIKEALNWAMKHGLWGHALFLSSKLDERIYRNVLTNFANGLPITDPIQTLYQLLSGWQPAAVTCVSDEEWGDWRPHLAMILSNASSNPTVDHKAIITLGDTLGARGCLHAAHFCYLMAQHPFGTYSQRNAKLVLLGSSHLKPFSEFASTEAIMITSIYEYARMLADSSFSIPNLQPYKFLMALRLAEIGFLTEAVGYCEAISRIVVQNPSSYDQGFIQNLNELGERLKYSDPSYAGVGDWSTMPDPDWLIQIRNLASESATGLSHGSQSFSSGMYDMQSSLTSMSLQDSSYNQDYQQPSSLQNQSYYYQQGWPQQQQQTGSQLHQAQPSLSASQSFTSQSIPEGDSVPSADAFGSSDADQNYNRWSDHDSVPLITTETKPSSMQLNSSNGEEPVHHLPQLPSMQRPSQQNAASTQPLGLSTSAAQGPVKVQAPSQAATSTTTSASNSNSSSSKSGKTQQAGNSWFGGLWNKLRPKNQMILPDDKNPSIVWDADKKRWVNTDGSDEPSGGELAPPPMTSSPFMAQASAGTPTPTPTSSSLGNGGVAMAYSTGAGAGPEAPAAAVPGADKTDSGLPPSGPNKFRLGRSAQRPAYVNVVKSAGGCVSTPAVPEPSVFPQVTSTQRENKYFIPSSVESDNAPVDFLTPANQPETTDYNQDSRQLSRWSSTSSLSREVQTFTGYRDRKDQQVAGGPQFFNPNQFQGQQALGSPSKGRKPF